MVEQSMLASIRGLGVVSEAHLQEEGFCDAPTWVLNNSTGLMVSPDTFDAAYKSALAQIVAALDAAGVIEYWPNEGTLISLMRYGGVAGELSAGQVDVVDKDIDLMVLSSAGSAFTDLVRRVRTELLKRKKGCWHCMDGPVVLARHFWKYRQDDSESFEPDFFSCSHVLPRDPAREINVELHRYLDAGNGKAYMQRQCANSVCTARNDSLMLKRYPGGMLPLELVRPLVWCRAFDFQLPCPRAPLELLTSWEGSKYRSGNAPCFALPDFNIQRNVFEMRHHRLLESGLTLEDFTQLQTHAERLHSGGFLSFFESYQPNGCADRARAVVVQTGRPMPVCKRCVHITRDKLQCKTDFGKSRDETVPIFTWQAQRLFCTFLLIRLSKETTAIFTVVHDLMDCSVPEWMRFGVTAFIRQAVDIVTFGLGGIGPKAMERLVRLPQHSEFAAYKKKFPDVALAGFLLGAIFACEAWRGDQRQGIFNRGCSSCCGYDGIRSFGTDLEMEAEQEVLTSLRDWMNQHGWDVDPYLIGLHEAGERIRIATSHQWDLRAENPLLSSVSSEVKEYLETPLPAQAQRAFKNYLFLLHAGDVLWTLKCLPGKFNS